MKTLNLLQNMSAEAKVLAMALPMLLLSALSSMAKQDEGYMFPEKMDMPHIIMQPGDSGRVQPVGYPDGSRLMQSLPAQKPEDAPIQGARVAGIDIPSPVSPDSARVESVKNPAQNGKRVKFPGQKPEDAGLDNFFKSGKPMPASPDSASVEPAQQPNENSWRHPRPLPDMQGNQQQQGNKGNPGNIEPLPQDNPGDDDVYESPYIKDNTTQSGIEEVAVDNQPSQAAQGVFTLSGLRVSESADLSGLAPGLYIVNGKKILVK